MFLRWYQTQLARKPLLTQSVMTAVLFATGDVLAQQGVEKVEKHDFARTFRMGLYGGAVFGPAATTWFKILSRVNLSSPMKTTVARVCCDQGIFAPIFIGVFLSSMSVMEGTDPKKKLESSYVTALTKNYMLWPWVQLANFRFTPLEHRVLVVNLVSIGWNCYLSYLNQQGAQQAAASEPKPEALVA